MWIVKPIERRIKDSDVENYFERNWVRASWEPRGKEKETTPAVRSELYLRVRMGKGNRVREWVQLGATLRAVTAVVNIASPDRLPPSWIGVWYTLFSPLAFFPNFILFSVYYRECLIATFVRRDRSTRKYRDRKLHLG